VNFIPNKNGLNLFNVREMAKHTLSHAHEFLSGGLSVLFSEKTFQLELLVYYSVLNTAKGLE